MPKSLNTGYMEIDSPVSPATSKFTIKKRGCDHVLRDIKELGCSKEFNLSNFGQISYTNAQGKAQPMICMTRDGFTLLVMGYTGGRRYRQIQQAILNICLVQY